MQGKWSAYSIGTYKGKVIPSCKKFISTWEPVSPCLWVAHRWRPLGFSWWLCCPFLYHTVVTSDFLLGVQLELSTFPLGLADPEAEKQLRPGQFSTSALTVTVSIKLLAIIKLLISKFSTMLYMPFRKLKRKKLN